MALWDGHISSQKANCNSGSEIESVFTVLLTDGDRGFTVSFLHRRTTVAVGSYWNAGAFLD